MDHTLLICDEDFIISGEDYDDRLWIHATVSRWSHKVHRQFSKALDVVSGHLGQPLYVLDDPAVATLPRFLRSMGFVPHSLQPHGGSSLTVFRRQEAPRGHPPDQH